MRVLFSKFSQKTFVQNLLVEVIGDVLMIGLGLIAGYYVKLFLLG